MGRLLALLAAAAALGSAAAGAAVPPGFTDSLVAGGLSSPTAMARAPDGRLFVAQQGGALRVIQNGVLLGAPFVTVPSYPPAGTERGLLGVALHPAFATNGFVYVYWTTAAAPVHNRVSRFTAAGNTAVAGSEVVILDLDNLSSATNHNGGAIHFGPDGKLYVAVGENADGANAQTLSNRLGKLLRLNADGTIPTDNPFYGVATGFNRSIWALGLRNPYTFAFQPGTGRMFINDVGQSTWEEINDGLRGRNYGWPIVEGPPPGAPDPNLTYPLFEYGHGSSPTTGCAITGGAFYNPVTRQFPADYVGDYFFADYCTGWIRRYDVVADAAFDFASGIANPLDLITDPDGSLLYLSQGAGSVRRVTSVPTAVGVHSLAATRVRQGVAVSWRLAGPSGSLLGFELYRGSARVGRLVPASTRTYRTVDRRAPAGAVTYRLIGVRPDGARLRLGSVRIR